MQRLLRILSAALMLGWYWPAYATPALPIPTGVDGGGTVAIPLATANSLGVVACGTGLVCDNNGFISATGLGATDLSNAQITALNGAAARTLAAWAGDRINVKSQGAKGDTFSADDAIVAAGSNAIASAKANWVNADAGKRFCLNDSGANRITQCGTITAVVDNHHITVSFTTVYPIPHKSIAWATPVALGINYVPGDTIGLTDTGVLNGLLSVGQTQAVAIAVTTGGSGGTDGACTITGTTGTGPKFTATGTSTGGALTGPLTVTFGGVYRTNPTVLSAEPVTTSCGITGATIAFTNGMGVYAAYVPTAGVYTGTLHNTATQGSTSGSGTGATFALRQDSSVGGYFYNTDDTAAFTAAVNTVNSIRVAGGNACMYIPAGVYSISAALPSFVNTGCVLGDSAWRSWIRVEPSMSGDIFSSQQTGEVGDYQPTGNQVIIGNSKAGFRMIGVSITGDRTSPNIQNAYKAYDETDDILFQDVNVRYLTGSCLSFGASRNSGSGFLRESTIINMECFGIGSPGVPGMDFSITGTSSGEDNIWCVACRVIFPYGPGIRMTSNNATGGNTRHIFFDGLQLHGVQNPAYALTGDLMQIGDPSAVGFTTNIKISHSTWNASYPGTCAIRITGAASTPSSGIQVNGAITSGDGAGVCVDAGNQIRIEMALISNKDFDVTVASSATTKAPIIVDGMGLESTWSYNIDPTAAQFVVFPTTSPLDFSVNSRTGTYTRTTGNGASDFGMWGWSCHASGNFKELGDLEHCIQVLGMQTSGASPIRLVAGGTGTASAVNSVNVPSNAVIAGTLSVSCHDTTNTVADYRVRIPDLLLERKGNVSTTQAPTLTQSTPVTLGTVTGALVTAAADTTLGGLNVQFTPPTGNVDLWKCVAVADFGLTRH